MKILHINLGLPPFRSGGLTCYSVDLATAQAELGNNVFLLFPGRLLVRNRVRIKEMDTFNKIRVFEIINPIPVPLLQGIRYFKHYESKKDTFCYKEFLEELKPDIIHIHTFMGIHPEFFPYARDLGIKLLFSTHDFFGICPKATLRDHETLNCTDYIHGAKCALCCQNGYGMMMLFLMQSRIYRMIKDTIFFDGLKKLYKIKSHFKKQKNTMKTDNTKYAYLPMAVNYRCLRNKFLKTLDLIDYFLFNSELSKKEYEKYGKYPGEILHITHRQIMNPGFCKNTKSSNTLNIAYLGGVYEYKGFYFLKEKLDELLKNGIKDWHLNIYGDISNLNFVYDKKHYTFHGKFKGSKISRILRDMDIVIVPSMCLETFGFIALEAISHGIPVMVSENVGAKTVIAQKGAGIVFSFQKNDFLTKLVSIINNPTALDVLRENVQKIKLDDFLLENHVVRIMEIYHKVLEGQ